MTTRLKLVCHASTAAVRSSAFPADEPLEPQGRRKLASAPRLGTPDRCWTSPASRAVQTAQAMHLDPAIEPALRECGYGRWTGRSFDDVQTQEPEAIAEWLQDPGSAPHGGESMLDVMERVAAWLDVQIGTPGRVVAVTHASVIRAAIVHAIAAGPRSLRHIDVAPLSLAALSGSHGRWTLVSLGAMAMEPDEGSA